MLWGEGQKPFWKLYLEKAMNRKRSRFGAGCVISTDNWMRQRPGTVQFSLFFIKENDLGTSERRSNMAKRREVPRRGKRGAKGRKGPNLKEWSLGQQRREAAYLRGKSPHWESEDLGWNPDSATSSCLPLGLSVHVYLFIYACQLCLKHNTAGGDGLTEINRIVPALQGLIGVDG